MHRTPKNAEELTRRIAELELESESLKEDIQQSAALLMNDLKPVNIIKNYFRPKPRSLIGKWTGKLLGGYKKVFRRPRGIKRLLPVKH